MQNETRQAAINHAIAAYPQESCGLVIIVKGRERYYPCRNIARSASDHFHMSPEDYAAAEDMGEITAVVHSHPNASSNPSEADRVMCESTGLPWYILSIAPGPEFHSETVIKPVGYKAPLVGREFHHGILDCYTLIRDYYQREHGIEVPDFPRTDSWWHRGENLYAKHFQDAGFYEIKPEDLRPGDGIIMQIRAPEPNHAGIYLGDNLFLHHFYGRLSSRDVYGGYWKEATRILVRHKDMK